MSKQRSYKTLGACLLAGFGNMAQAEVAHLLHVSPAAVSKWVNGVSRPQATNVGHLCAIFGLSLERIALLANYDIYDPDVMDKIEGTYRDRLMLVGRREAEYENVEN